MDIGFIGLGRMGTPMTLKLIRNGHRLLVHDTQKSACESAINSGAQWISNPAELTHRTKFIISSVPGPIEVSEVMIGQNGLLEGNVDETLIIETSTIGPDQSRDLATKFKEKGGSYLDATVNRIKLEDVAEGHMTIMVGGEPADFQRAKPILECLGDKVHHIGPTGSGNAVKLINQMIFLSYFAVFSEGLALGNHLGLKSETLLDVFSTSAAGHGMIIDKYSKISSLDESSAFTIDRVIKDLQLANELCRNQKFSAPTFSAALVKYLEAARDGLGSSDVTEASGNFHKISQENI